MDDEKDDTHTPLSLSSSFHSSWHHCWLQKPWFDSCGPDFRVGTVVVDGRLVRFSFIHDVRFHIITCFVCNKFHVHLGLRARRKGRVGYRDRMANSWCKRIKWNPFVTVSPSSIRRRWGCSGKITLSKIVFKSSKPYFLLIKYCNTCFK